MTTEEDIEFIPGKLYFISTSPYAEPFYGVYIGYDYLEFDKDGHTFNGSMLVFLVGKKRIRVFSTSILHHQEIE